MVLALRWVSEAWRCGAVQCYFMPMPVCRCCDAVCWSESSSSGWSSSTWTLTVQLLQPSSWGCYCPMLLLSCGCISSSMDLYDIGKCHTGQDLRTLFLPPSSLSYFAIYLGTILVQIMACSPILPSVLSCYQGPCWYLLDLILTLSCGLTAWPWLCLAAVVLHSALGSWPKLVMICGPVLFTSFRYWGTGP